MSPSAFFFRLPDLETEDLILRKPRIRDAKDIYSYASDPEVARYVLWEPHRSVSETAGFSALVIVSSHSPGATPMTCPSEVILATAELLVVVVYRLFCTLSGVKATRG